MKNPALAKLRLVGLVAPLLFLSLACNDGSNPVVPDPLPDLSSPEAVVEQLQVAYREQDIELYAELLAAEFIFRFQPLDQAPGREFWIRDQDSTGTDALFRTPIVSTIRVELLHGPTEDPGPGFDADVRKIRMTGVQLEVDQTDGITLRVTDIQEMFFRPGREVLREDPERWFLLEWRDIPSTFSPRPMVETTTWGLIKSLYN